MKIILYAVENECGNERDYNSIREKYLLNRVTYSVVENQR